MIIVLVVLGLLALFNGNFILAIILFGLAYFLKSRNQSGRS